VRVRKRVRRPLDEGDNEGLEGDSALPLNEILEKESVRTRSVVTERDAVETVRRREEMLRDLSAILDDLDREAALVGEKFERFRAMREAVAAGPEQVSQQRLGDVKKAIREAHMELVKHHRDSLAAEHAVAGVDWPSLSFGQLMKIGLGLGWPLILGVLAAAAVISAALLAVFGVG
jgi:hypothetical protein